MIQFIKKYQDVDRTFCAGWVAGFSQSKEQRLIAQGYAVPAPEGARALKRQAGQAPTVACVNDPDDMQAAEKGAVVAPTKEKEQDKQAQKK